MRENAARGILEQIVRCAWRTDYTTKATLVRKVDRLQPTLLLDELDAALKGNVEYVEALRGVLNSGYLRSGAYSMCIGQGAHLIDKDFRTFCPKVLAGIGVLPRTVASRSIPITLKRRAKNEPVSKWRQREGRTEASPIHDELMAWAAGAINFLRVHRPDFPPLDSGTGPRMCSSPSSRLPISPETTGPSEPGRPRCRCWDTRRPTTTALASNCSLTSNKSSGLTATRVLSRPSRSATI